MVQKRDVNFTFEAIYNYTLISDDNEFKIASSEELDSMDLSKLEKRIINLPKGVRLNTNSEAWNNFIDTVNAMDELLELRGFDGLGDSEINKEDSESTYRGIVFPVVKTVGDTTYNGKIENFIRVAVQHETRSSRINRASKMEDSANSEEAKALNNGNPLEVGEFESIVVKCTVTGEDEASLPNKQFYTYADPVRYLDEVLDRWEL